jgi:hypothetical protein
MVEILVSMEEYKQEQQETALVFVQVVTMDITVKSVMMLANKDF